MFNTKLQRGFLINQIQGFLLRAMNVVESESDLLVKIARKIKNDPNITHDHQIFRKIRAKTNTIEEIQEYFSIPLPNDYPDIKNYDKTALGQWFILKGTIFAFSQNFSDTVPLKKYWRYLDAHCDLEYEFILEARSKGDESLTEAYLRDWLLVDGVDITAKDNVQMVSYAIRMTMYWAANLELYLDLKYGSDIHSVLLSVLPSTYVKNGSHYFNPSSEKLLFRLNLMWAKKEYGKSKITNEKLFRDILRKQIDDPDIGTSGANSSRLNNVSPDTSAIKKRFHRWSQGKLFTLKHFKEDIAILNRSFADSSDDLTVLLPYVLVNLFTLAQMDLMKMRIDPELIEREFANYPTYKKLVKKRYDEFIVSGELKP
jgi:hypothetical protein